MFRGGDGVSQEVLQHKLLSLIDLTLFGQSQKSSNFSWGGFAPQTPPSSRLLSQPPQARLERLSQVGRCRGLQGWKYLVNGLECRLQNSQVISKQACRFRNFLSGPHSGTLSAIFSPHFQEMREIMPTQLTLFLFFAFPGNA